MKNEKLRSIEIKTEGKAERCVIWLHGLGADGNDFVPIVPELNLPANLNIKFVFPNAPVMPVSINNGYQMPAWFDISHNGISADVDRAGIANSMTDIGALIKHEEDSGIQPGNIMLAGFSQGAVIALMTGLHYPKRLAGIIALSGLLLDAETAIQQGSAANRDIPIFIGHGSEDQMVSAALGKTAYDALERASYPVEWHTYPMAHSVCSEEIHDISHWMQKIWQ